MARRYILRPGIGLLLSLAFTLSSEAASLPQIPQEVLNPLRTYRTLGSGAQNVQTSRYLDAAPNSVGILFTTAGGEEEEVIHLWLPLGSRVNARDSPFLPLHPLTARITTMVSSSPEKASTEYLDAIECSIYPAFNAPAQVSDLMRKTPEGFAAVQFSRADGLMSLASEFGVGGLGGWEVEAYECS